MPSVDHLVDFFHPRSHFGCPQLEQVIFPRLERVFAQPEQAHPQASGYSRGRLVGQSGQLAAGDKNLFLQAQPGGLPYAGRLLNRRIEGFNGFDPGVFPGWIKDHFVAYPQAAADYTARHDTPVVAKQGELVHILHRQAEGLV